MHTHMSDMSLDRVEGFIDAWRRGRVKSRRWAGYDAVTAGKGCEGGLDGSKHDCGVHRHGRMCILCQLGPVCLCNVSRLATQGGLDGCDGLRAADRTDDEEEGRQGPQRSSQTPSHCMFPRSCCNL